MIQDIVDTMDVVQHLDHIGHLHGLEGLPNLALPEDSFHLLTGQTAAGHPGRGVSKVDHHIIVQSMIILLFLLILQLFGQFWQLGFFCMLRNCAWWADCVLWDLPNTIFTRCSGYSALSTVSSN